MWRLPFYASLLVAWNVMGVVLLAFSWLVIGPADSAATRRQAGAEDPGRTFVYAIVVLMSGAGLFASTIRARVARKLSPDLSGLVAALSLFAVASAWMMTHTAFTFRYARLYYRDDAEGIGGIELPKSIPPTYFDFAYFAFTIGMCFQVSDVCILSRQNTQSRPFACAHQHLPRPPTRSSWPSCSTSSSVLRRNVGHDDGVVLVTGAPLPQASSCSRSCMSPPGGAIECGPPRFSSHVCAKRRSGGWTARATTATRKAPPMTTTARGFCVCDPMPVETAAGNRPIIALQAVVARHGRSRFSVASFAAS